MNNSILVVENDLTTQVLLRGILKKHGYTVCGILSRGDQIEDFLKDHVPDLVIMDIMLDGDIDGIEAASIMQSTHDIPVIFLTSHGSVDLIERAIRLSTYGFLSKPFKDIDLLTVIRLAIGRHAAEILRWENKERYRQLFQSSSDPIFILNAEGEILECNEAALQKYGLTRDTLSGHTFNSLLVDDFESDALQEELIPYNDENIQWHWGSNRVPFPVEIRMVEYHSKGHVLKSVIVRDITAHLLMLQEQRQIVDQIKSVIINLGKNPVVSQQNEIHGKNKKTLFDLGATQKEAEVATYLLKGLSNKEIASQMNLSVETIKSHVSSILKKTGMRNRVELINYIIKEKISLGTNIS